MLAFTACTDEVKFEKTKKRAEAGDIEAQSRLGHLYAYAEGVSVDFVESVKWFRKAAEQGHVDAQFRLACHYREGRGVPENDAEAAKWFRKAAEKGDSLAWENFVDMYVEGPRDDAEAAKWIRKAAEQGDVSVQLKLGHMYSADGNDAEAAKWFRNAAEQGEWKAQAALGKMYFEGKGVPRDYVEAYAWFNVQAVQGGGGRFDRDSVDELLTPEARAQAQQRSTQLFNEIEKNKKKAGK